MTHDDAVENEPWWHNPWVWLIIAIPGLTIIGCMVTIYLAISRPVHLVTDPVRDEPPAIETSREATG